MNNITEITGFLNTTLSFFFPAFNKSINLYLAAEKRFNIITSKYIIAKYIIVFTKASSENTNLNPVISASNIFATNIDISCEPNIPIINPTANENIPIRNVSKSNIVEIFLLPIPKSIYSPNSFFLLFIKKLFA